LESEHGITCECGQTFKTSEEYNKHVVIGEVLAEVKRIGGEKFYTIAKQWENNGHSGGLREFATTHGLELRPENATQIAKKEINHMVQHYEEYHINRYQDGEGDRE